MRHFLLILFAFTNLFAQAQEVDKGSWYGSIIRASATGEYKSYLENYEVKTSRIGLSIGYLVNLQKKSKVNSPIQLGLELGFMPWGTDPVDTQAGGSFTNEHRSFWINGVARYRPVLEASTINPYFDLFVGPSLIHSRITEYFSSDETQNIFGLTKNSRNYGLGAGIGIKREKQNGELRYFDIGLYYQHVQKVRSIKRRSGAILSDGSISHAETIIKPSNLQVRVGLTGFL